VALFEGDVWDRGFILPLSYNVIQKLAIRSLHIKHRVSDVFIPQKLPQKFLTKNRLEDSPSSSCNPQHDDDAFA
jgi:hypothetical protein